MNSKQMIAVIDERVKFLNSIKNSISIAFGDVVYAKPAPKAQRKPYAVSNTQPMILSVLADAGPLTLVEIHDRLLLRDWQTTSGNPRGLLGVTLSNMQRAGKIRKLEDKRWELVPQPSA